MPRKPVACAVLRTLLVVVCDDGSVWELDPNGQWIERSAIPGTEADVAAQAKRWEDE